MMRQVVNEVGAEFEKMSLLTLQELIDNPHAAYEFERQVKGRRLHFVLQEFRSEGKDGWQLEVSGLPTILGIALGYHFFKDSEGNIIY